MSGGTGLLMSRRDFVRVATASVFVPPIWSEGLGRGPNQLTVGILRGPGADMESAVQFTSGFELGIVEAKHAPALFGKSISSPGVDSTQSKDMRARIVALAESGVQAIVFDGSASDAA